MGMSDRTIIALAGILVVGFLVANGTINLSALSGPGAGDAGTSCGDVTVQNPDLCGTSASLVLSASEFGASAKVATTVYAEMADGETRSTTLASGSDTTWDVFTVGERIDRLFALNESGYYPIEMTDIAVDSERVTKRLKVADQTTTGNLDLAWRDDSSDITSITLNAGEQESIDSYQFEVRNSDDYYNGYMVVVDYPDTSNQDANVSISNWEGAEQTVVPDSVASSYDEAYVVYDAAEGTEPAAAFQEVDSGAITFEADDTNDPAGTITVTIKDLQAFEDEDGSVRYAVEDEDGNDLGVADKTDTLTVN